MKFTLSWLKEFLKTNATLEEIINKLNSIGLEVENIENRAKGLEDFKIAKIISAQKHPNAEKLQVCQVNDGNNVLQIVCGAANARAGLYVTLAPIGALIPTNGLVIKESQIRGVTSQGMLCSASELALDSDNDGIMELTANDNDLGQKFAQFLLLDDPIIELSITPNRGDCLGVYGIARDLAASGLGELIFPKYDLAANSFQSGKNVKINSSEGCSQFIARYFRNVSNSEQSPEWLKQRLESIGKKSISRLVDITNYINFTFGRPLHVYDADKITGNLQVRFAKNGEKITALDNQIYDLSNDILVISDDVQPKSVAGIIGGLDSGCGLDTKNVILEVAVFDPIIVAKAGRGLQILSDSRYRFERGVDAEFIENAAKIATKMIIDLCGGEASEIIKEGDFKQDSKIIQFDRNMVENLLGCHIDDKLIDDILSKLGFKIQGNSLTVPSWRHDVNCPQDIVEEIARIYGYDNIPNIAMPKTNINNNVLLSVLQKNIAKTRRALVQSGMDEIVSWSFMSLKKSLDFGVINDELVILNPISSELDIMRSNILPNLLDIVQKNYAKGVASCSIFEIGPVFLNPKIDGQKLNISGVRFGTNVQKNIFATSRQFDVFDVKADALYALEMMGASVDNLQIAYNIPSYYHPGKSASLQLGKNILAYFGQIHPKILAKFDLTSPVFAFELLVDNINLPKNKKSKARKKLIISPYQSSVRDFAFLVDEAVSIEDILRVVRNVNKDLIRGINLFDIYRGKNIDDGKKSIAFSVTIQSNEKTLTDSEIEVVSQNIIDNLAKNFNASLRG